LPSVWKKKLLAQRRMVRYNENSGQARSRDSTVNLIPLELRVILSRKGQKAGVDRALGSVSHSTSILSGSPANPREFGRFFLSSAGLHLILAWAVMAVGLHRAPLSERPLIVKLIEAEAPRSAPPTPQPVRPRSRRQAAVGRSIEPGEEREIAPRDLVPSSIARPVTSSQPPEIAKTAEPDERRQTASPRAAAELVKDLGLPAAALPSGRRIVDGDRTEGPKAIGTMGRVAVIPGGSASGPAFIGDGLEGAGQGTSARGAGGTDGRRDARRLGAEISIPVARTVTVNPRQRGFGREGSARGARAAGGGFARPDYGANSPPTYPPLAREKGYEGTVYLRALVERDGRVGNLLIDRSSGHEILDRAAVDSVRGWTFLPAQKDGKPVASWVLLPVKFVLN
jgi:protein TonB